PQFPPSLAERSTPIRRRVPDGCASRLFTASMAFAVLSAARLPLSPTLTGRTSNDAAGFASCCGPLSCTPHRAFHPGLRPDPFPAQAASLLPGLLAATRTRLTPASDDEREHEDHPNYVTRSPPVPLGARKIWARAASQPWAGKRTRA